MTSVVSVLRDRGLTDDARNDDGVTSSQPIQRQLCQRVPNFWQGQEQNGRVDDQDFYQLLDRDGIADDIRLFNEKLREWEDYYNYHRPHGALAGQTALRATAGENEAEPLPNA